MEGNIGDLITFEFDYSKFDLIFPLSDYSTEGTKYQESFYLQYPGNDYSLGNTKEMFSKFHKKEVIGVISYFSHFEKYPVIEFDTMQISRMRDSKIDFILS
jgi:hypothetical protein